MQLKIVRISGSDSRTSFPGTFVPWNFVPKSKISMELSFPDTDNYWTHYPYVVLII